MQRRMFVALLATGVLGWFAPPAKSQCQDRTIVIQQDNAFSNGIRFFLSAHNTTEATVKFNLDFIQNGTPSHPLPYIFCVSKNFDHYELLRITQTVPHQQWHFGPYTYHFVLGAPSNLSTVDYIYSLPYPASKHFVIGQSYFGTFTHKKGSPEEYAVDINMPEGTPVLAARQGTVIACRSDSDSGGNSEKYKDSANYITVKHNDGTYAAYVHLKKDGVAVKTGQAVSSGTLLGYSGQTGFVSCPHLHFMVYRVLPAPVIQTIAFRTRTTEGVIPQLLQGQSY